MRKIFKVFIIVGICLLLSGGSIFTVALAKNDWDIKALSNVDYKSEMYTENPLLIDEIQVIVDDGDVRVEESAGTEIEIDYYIALNKKGKVLTEFNVALIGRVLIVKEVSKKRIFSLYNASPDVVIKIPTLKKTALKLVSDTGDITFKGENTLLLSSLDVKTDTGKVTLSRQINCDGNVKFTTDTGNVKLYNTLKANAVTINTDTGDLITKGCVWADSVTVNTDTGDIKLILKGVKGDYSYVFHSDTGKSNVHSYETTGAQKSINITTDTGDVKLYFSE